MTYDIFISYASEDRETVAEPLANALIQQGLTVWYDKLALTMGDSLRQAIDEGLSKSKYGVVILSPNFFEKDWPQKELNALVAREEKGVKVILPVWHNVTHKDVAKFSPILADRWAVSTSEGLEKIVHQIKRAIKLDEQKKDPLIMIGTINLLTHELTIDGKILST